MGSCAPIAKCVLVLVNIFFLLIGQVLLALGLFVRFGSSVINDKVDGAKAAIQNSVNSAGTFGTIDLSNFDLTETLRNVAVTLICLGLFLSIITFLGCCGGCCKVKKMLIVYIGISSLILLGQMVVVGILYEDPDVIHNPVKKELRKKIHSDYSGLNGTDINTVAWNVVMQEIKCCGIDNYDDFTGASNWITDYTANTPPVTLKTPLACCKVLPSTDDFSCAGAAASETDNYLSTGCYDKILDYLAGNFTIVTAVVVLIFLIQLGLIICAFILVCSGEHAKQNKVAPNDEGGTPPPYSEKARPFRRAPRPRARQNLKF